MIRKLARHTVLAAALASLALAARADISEGRYASHDTEAYVPVAPSEVRILDREPASDFEAVGTVEAFGKDEPDLEILEQVNGLRPPSPLAFFGAPAPRNGDDAGLAMHALKTVAARHGVQALYIIESGRAQIRSNVVGHRIVAKAFRRKARHDQPVSGPR
jgi:hypothetical protein